jgi:hypothetical protein
MLRAVPKHWFSWDFSVFDDGEPVAMIRVPWFGERAEFHIQGETYEACLEGWGGSGQFVLRDGSTVLARAEKPTAFRWRFRIESEDGRFELRSVSLLRAFGLFQNETQTGSICLDKRFFTRRTTIDLPNTVLLPVQIFLFWLVLVLRRRR